MTKKKNVPIYTSSRAFARCAKSLSETGVDNVVRFPTSLVGALSSSANANIAPPVTNDDDVDSPKSMRSALVVRASVLVIGVDVDVDWLVRNRRALRA